MYVATFKSCIPVSPFISVNYLPLLDPASKGQVRFIKNYAAPPEMGSEALCLQTNFRSSSERPKKTPRADILGNPNMLKKLCQIPKSTQKHYSPSQKRSIPTRRGDGRTLGRVFGVAGSGNDIANYRVST